MYTPAPPLAAPPTTGPSISPRLTAAILYVLTAVLLLWRIGKVPPYPFNWEEYTAWNVFSFWEPGPFWGPILAPGNGVMTDSGQGLLVGFPVSASFALFGVGLAQMRIPVALIAALAPALLWLAGRKLLTPRIALIGAVLLAVCPVYVLYARTATLVGVSLVPLLLALWALASVLTAPAGSMYWPAMGLAGSLTLGVFAYAPMRMMWPIAVVTLLAAAGFDRLRRGTLLGAALLALVSVPAALVVMDARWSSSPAPVKAVSGYFRARDETLLHMRDSDRLIYLRQDAPTFGPPALRLILQNLRDMIRVMFDRGTMPLVSDYWNASGSIWPAWMGVLVLAGAVLAAVWAVRRRDGLALLVLVCAAGFAAPLLLTSRVDSGRLLAAAPCACLLAALALDAGTGALGRMIARYDPRSWLVTTLPVALPIAAALALVGFTAEGMRHEAMLTRQVREGFALESISQIAPAAGVNLVVDPRLGPEIERVHAASYRLQLDQVYRFEDMNGPDALVRGPGRPALRYGEVLQALENGDFIGGACDAVYAVQPEVRERLIAALKPYECSAPPQVIELPQ
ncbi:MAG: glycosyltransferase family 39 protein [Thermomicrobiales bacterium]